MEKRLEVLLVEDDPADCKAMIKELDANAADFYLAGVTGNSKEAFELVEKYRPHVVILDLELHLGGGDGLDFLKRLQSSRPSCPPYILVTTNNISKITHDAARSLGADFIMTKCQSDYSPAEVCNFIKNIKMQILKRQDGEKQVASAESEEQREKRLKRRICHELNAVGISQKAVGYKYLVEGILLVINGTTNHLPKVIGNIYKKGEDSVERAMQNAINRTWNSADPEDLLANYKAKISSDRGVPTLTEFLFYYAQKIDND